MKLLLDQGLPRSSVRHLADMGIAAEHVGDLGMATATDADILEAARQRQAVVVTLDSDFHTQVSVRKLKETHFATHPARRRVGAYQNGACVVYSPGVSWAA